MRHFFSAADALQINKKLMAQMADSEALANDTPDPDSAKKSVKGATITFSVKEMNDAMTKARELLAA